jgi:hypothetical protein
MLAQRDLNQIHEALQDTNQVTQPYRVALGISCGEQLYLWYPGYNLQTCRRWDKDCGRKWMAGRMCAKGERKMLKQGHINQLHQTLRDANQLALDKYNSN